MLGEAHAPLLYGTRLSLIFQAASIASQILRATFTAKHAHTLTHI